MNSFRILKRHLTVFRRTWWTNAMFNFFEPVFYITAFGYGFGSFVTEMEGMTYLQFIASGTVASSAMWAATFEGTFGAFIRMHYQKTFHAMLFTPATVTDVVLGEAFYAAIKSVFFSGIILAVIAALGQVHSWWALLVPFGNALPGLAFAFLALAYTGIVTNIDYLNYYITLLMTPLFLVSGVFFPVSALPAWIQGLAAANPLYHCVEMVRMLIRGDITAVLAGHVLFLAVFAVAVSFLPVRMLRRRLIN